MKIYEIIPQKDMRRLTLLTSAFLIGATLIMALTSIFEGIPFKWAFQLLGVIMLALGIFYLTRYVMKSFIYRIEATDSGHDLTVTEIQGRHIITVCRISLSGIEEVYVARPNDSLEMKSAVQKARSGNRKQYNYCVDMFGDKCLFILATECGEPIALRLSYDEKLTQFLDTAKQMEE